MTRRSRPSLARRFLMWWVVYEEIRQTDGSRNVYVNVLPAVTGVIAAVLVHGAIT